MKRVLSSIITMVLLLSAIASATVDFTLSSPSDGLVTIGYNASSGEDLKVVALSLSLSDQATFPLPYVVSVHPQFGGVPDTLLGGDLGGPEGPGLGVPISQISIYLMASEDRSTPAAIDNLITLQIQDGGEGFSYATLSEDMLRGGVMDTSGNHVEAAFPESLYVTIPEPVTLSLLAFGGMTLLRKRKKMNPSKAGRA